MAKYSDIKGFTVQTVSSDPVASGIAGATWSSIASLNTARESVSSGGTTTAGIVAGGYDGEGYPSGYTGLTETWNGSAWTETADMNSGRTTHGFGTSTALIAGAGNRGVSSPPSAPGYQNLVESWNGSAWTEVAEYNNNKSSRGTAGQSGTAGIVFGGITPAGGDGDYTESWNGSSWTELGDLNASRYNLATNAGTQTSALGVGGQFPSPPQDGTLVESWNGSSWTEIAELNTARNKTGGSGTGNTSLLVFGGNPGKKANTESWDGSSWTERNDLSTAREGNGGFGTSTTSAIYAGGQDATTYTAVSEEFSPAGATESLQVEGQLFFNSTTNTFKETITDIPGTSWASGGSLNEARTGLGSSRNASSNASVAAFGGFNASGAPLVARDETELYNGTSWTEVADMNTARGQVGGAGGSSTSAIVFGGEVYPNPSNQTITETWDGSSWTETAEMNTAGRSLGNTGTQTNAFAVAGTPTPSRSTKCELWNGSAWTEVNDYPTAKNYVTVAGIYTAALGVGGTPSPFTEANTWDGTSWTEITSASQHSGTGQGFGSPAPVSMIKVDNDSCEFWNGSSWTEINDLSTARQEGGASGATTNGLVCGGSSPTTGATEEFEVGLANKTITAS
jgi:hypothetical protein